MPGSKFASGISQSVNDNPEVTEARRDHLPWTSQAFKPGVPFSTRKPRTLSSSALAHTTAMSAREPLVIHIFSPFKTYLEDRKSTRLNSSHRCISYAVFCLKKKKKKKSKKYIKLIKTK